METVFIITGVNRGLGEALYNELIQLKATVFAISRRFNENQKPKDNTIHWQKDLINLNEEELTNHLKLIYPKHKNIIYINNAATINPIGKVGSFTEKEIRNSYNLNVITPVLLSNHILKNTTKNQKIVFLNISSGAAKRPIAGWSLYNSTKAANEMFYNCIVNDNVTVLNINPGVINTKMQDTIRKSNMPDVADFINLQKENKLQEPKDVAIKILTELYENSHIVRHTR